MSKKKEPKPARLLVEYGGWFYPVYVDRVATGEHYRVIFQFEKPHNGMKWLSITGREVSSALTDMGNFAEVLSKLKRFRFAGKVTSSPIVADHLRLVKG